MANEPSKAARERARAVVNGHFGMVEKARNGERLVAAIAAALDEYAAERTAQEQANTEALARTAEKAAVYWRQRAEEAERERDAVRAEVETLRARVAQMEPSRGWHKVSGCQECAEHGARYCPKHGELATDGGQGHE